jgi:hypothetical protein
MASRAGVDVEVDGLTETLKAFQGLEKDLRRTANGELRQAAGECAGQLAIQLRGAASSSGVPVAPRVARSIRVKSDRLPVVTVGGYAKVGRTGAIAAKLLWGSERGPAGGGEVNHFAVPRNPSGYWLAPTIDRFRNTGALTVYKRSVYQIMRKWGLV